MGFVTVLPRSERFEADLGTPGSIAILGSGLESKKQQNVGA
jgi:hypothetical protein